MKSYSTIDSLCHRIEEAMLAGKLAQAHLLLSPLQVPLKQMVQAVTAVLLCEGQRSRCQQCRSCRFYEQGQHPDCLVPGYDPQEDSRIKIADVRALQETIYTPPKIAARRVVLLNRVDHLNLSAANALLKILEEPPSYLYFVLSAQHLNTVLPTIRSRCQLWRFDAMALMNNYFEIADFLESEYVEIFAARKQCLKQMVDIMNGEQHPCDVAGQWSGYPFGAILLFLYLVNALAIRCAMQIDSPFLKEYEGIASIAKMGLTRLFQQIDTITANIKREESGLSTNKTLILEQLLMAYRERCYERQ